MIIIIPSVKLARPGFSPAAEKLISIFCNGGGPAICRQVALNQTAQGVAGAGGAGLLDGPGVMIGRGWFYRVKSEG